MMKQIGLTICFLLGVLQFVVAQSKAEELFDKANELAEAGEFKLANNQLKEAATLYKKDNNMSGYYRALAEQGRNTLDMGDGQKALKYLESLEKEAATVFKKPDIAQSLIHKYIGYVYYYDKDMVGAYKPFQKALAIRTAVDPKDKNLFRDNYNLGVIYRNISHYEEALECYQAALDLLGDDAEHKYLATIYLQIATVYKRIENYGAAEDYIERALNSYEAIYGKESLDLASTIMEKGNIQILAASSASTIKEGIKTLKEAVALLEAGGDDYLLDLAIAHQSIATAYRFMGVDTKKESDYELALKFYLKAEKVIDKVAPVSLENLTGYLATAQSYLGMKNLDKAELYLDKNKKMLDELNFESKNINRSRSYLFEAKLAMAKKEDITKVAAIYDQAILALLENTDKLPKDLNLLPYLKNAEVISAAELTTILSGRMYMYTKAYEEKKDVAFLEKAMADLNEFEKVVDFIRVEYTASGSKLAWSDFVVEDFGKGINICLTLAREKKDDSYLEKAYYFSEKSKALLLLESFQSTKASKFSGLPEGVLAEEEKLRLATSDARQQLFQLKQGGKLESEAYGSKQTEWLDKKQTYADFVKRMEKEHPAYYKMKYDLNILDVAATQEMLLEDQDLIEYYVTDEHIYAFKIGKSSFEVKDLKAPNDLLEDVGNFRGSIYNYYLNAGERTEKGYDKYSNQYAEVGYKMYQTLIEPLGELKKRLIIIPAGALANMPFEPILMEKPETPKNYKSHKYLTKKHIIAYNYSATLLSEMRNRNYGNNRETLLAIAPEFGTDAASFVRGKRFALAPLTFNTVEVENVRKMLGKGTLLMGQDAIEPKFKEMGGNYKIIHFATHGMANDRDPDFSLLAFTDIPDSVENEFLYVNDLYNMELNTDLIVLSACETGLGEMRKGEGVISLARGFAYAGTKSIFTTLWSVNDQATANIIEGFYSYLKAGKPKDEALHLAKLDFLEGGNNMTSHPFLWAPYIFIGDSAPMNLGGGFPWLYVGIGGLALALLLGAFFMMKKGKSNKEEAA